MKINSGLTFTMFPIRMQFVSDFTRALESTKSIYTVMFASMIGQLALIEF